ncbi:MAG: ABC transporter permease [Candidatus Bipolaricaulaceae bacterium]
MRRFWTFWAIFVRFLIELKRYPFNTLSSLVTLYLIFLFLFAGAKYAQGFGVNVFGENLEALVVGFLVWTFALLAYSDLAWEVMREAQQGTLEQLYMCPFGFGFVSISWVLSSFFTSFLFVGVLLLLMMTTTGKFLHLPVGTLVPLLFLTLAPIYGVGVLMAGLALVFKRIQAFFQILQFAFVPLLFLPREEWWAKALPISLGSSLIREVMTEGKSLLVLPGPDLLVVLGTAIFYFGLGLFVFKVCERVAKDRGLLAHY